MRKNARAVCGTLLFILFFLSLLFPYLLLNAPAFENGKTYTFYAEKNSSSKAYVTNTPVLLKLFLGHVAGESVVYLGDRVEELKKKFRAELMFFEEACGVQNFYFYSPKFKDAVILYGKRVNLHIALSKEQTAAGTPLIFGGF